MNEIKVSYSNGIVIYRYNKIDNYVTIITDKCNVGIKLDIDRKGIDNIINYTHSCIIGSFIIDVGALIILIRNVILPKLIQGDRSLNNSIITFDHHGTYTIKYENDRITKEWIVTNFYI